MLQALGRELAPIIASALGAPSGLVHPHQVQCWLTLHQYWQQVHINPAPHYHTLPASIAGHPTVLTTCFSTISMIGSRTVLTTGLTTVTLTGISTVLVTGISMVHVTSSKTATLTEHRARCKEAVHPSMGPRHREDKIVWVLARVLEERETARRTGSP